MANVTTDIAAFPVKGGQCAGYLAKPTNAATAPGVVVVQEWWGLNEHVKDVTRRFAAEGFTALAPDLYRGTVTDDGSKAAALMQELDVPNAVQDILGAVRYLGRIGAGKIGIVGFCLGGKLTIQAAIEGGDAVAAAVPFYGFNPNPVSEARRITAPVLAFYGGKDTMVTPDDAEAFETELRQAGGAVEAHSYRNAGHAFFNDTRPEAYDPEAAKDAWQRALAFLKQHLSA